MKEITSVAAKDLLPKRSGEGHKGTFGTAVAVAGSPSMTGAQVLVTDAALRSGVGIARIYAPSESLLPSRLALPSAVISVFPDTAEETVREERARMKKQSCYVIGPGIDAADPRMQMMLYFLIDEAPSVVIDATALRMIASAKELYMPLLASREEKGLSPAVLTPHAGELAALTGLDIPDTDGMLRAALGFGCIVAAKFGAKTYVIDPSGEIYLNDKVNSGLGKGGSGDVLAGLITGLAAQGMTPLDACICGVRVHSEAGEYAARLYGERFMQPTDVINCLKYVYEGKENG